MKKVSVIVPVYNVEDYLPRCLDSLLKQGIEDNRTKMICRTFNFIFSNFIIYKTASWFFNQVFAPYILPTYRKRVWSSN